MNRLVRLGRLFVEVPHYFVTACTDGRRELLGNEPAHQVFRQFCSNARQHGAWVGRYVLMPDH